MASIGIDIGGTTFKCGVVSENNEIIDKIIIAFDDSWDTNECLEKIDGMLEKCLKKHQQIQTIGIGVPGVIKDGVILIAPNLNWKNLNIRQYFLNKYDTPIFIENDANVAALAELIAGNGKNTSHFMYVTLGTGIGGSVVINRQIYKGLNGGAGEFGHILIDINQDAPNCVDYRKGVIEEFVGREKIIKLATKNGFLCADNFDVKEIADAVKNGNQIAINTFNEVGKYLGRTLASLANIFDITCFIIGGGISNSNYLLNRIEEQAKKYSLPYLSEKIVIKQAKFKDAGIIGASMLNEQVFANLII